MASDGGGRSTATTAPGERADLAGVPGVAGASVSLDGVPEAAGASSLAGVPGAAGASSLAGVPGVAFVDLHCHTSASFDCLADPLAVVRAARSRGITHLAITDHDRIDGALRARDTGLEGITVLVGEEVKTTSGDLVCVFLEEAIPPGLPPAEAIARARAQGALVGIPHPFDRYRGSMGRAEDEIRALVGLVDWIETHNARIVGGKGNELAAALARETGLPGVAVSDAHSVLEVGVAATRMVGDPSTPAGLLAALAEARLVPGRASYYVRLLTPVAKLVQRVRGNGRVRPADEGAR